MAAPDTKQRLFVYDRKEMIVLSLLGVFVALFAFTLGIHLGKRLTPASSSLTGSNTPEISGISDSTPNRQELAEKAKGIEDTVEESLDRTLHEEVIKTGIKLDQPRQVQLPGHAKTKNAGATTLHSDADETAQVDQSVYLLQVGSHPVLDEAREQIQLLESKGLKPEMKIADLKGKGVWYRVFLTDFPSKEAAQKAGDRYKSDKVIDSFIVTKKSD